MKSFYEKYQNSPEESKDGLLSGAVNKMLDKQLLSEIEAELSVEDPVAIQKNILPSRRRWLRVTLAAAASIAILVIGYINLSDAGDVSNLTNKYLSESVPTHPGVEKGASEQATKNRMEAIKSFNDGDYVSASELFNQIPTRDEEDNYYLALSSLYAGQHAEAIPMFQNLLQNENSKYTEEINWYLVSAYVLNADYENATKQLGQINPGNWNYDKAQRLLKKLSKNQY